MRAAGELHTHHAIRRSKHCSRQQQAPHLPGCPPRAPAQTCCRPGRTCGEAQGGAGREARRALGTGSWGRCGPARAPRRATVLVAPLPPSHPASRPAQPASQPASSQPAASPPARPPAASRPARARRRCTRAARRRAHSMRRPRGTKKSGVGRLGGDTLRSCAWEVGAGGAYICRQAVYICTCTYDSRWPSQAGWGGAAAGRLGRRRSRQAAGAARPGWQPCCLPAARCRRAPCHT